MPTSSLPEPTVFTLTGAAGETPGTCVSTSELSATLRDWIATNHATEAHRLFQQLLIEVFPKGTAFAFTLESDPESEETSVVCVATLPHGHPVKGLSYYGQFVAKWARLGDPHLSGLFTLLVR